MTLWKAKSNVCHLTDAQDSQSEISSWYQQKTGYQKMSGAAGPSKKPKTYHFLAEWEEDFFFTMSFSKCICLICQTTIATLKQLFIKKYDTDFPLKSELRKRKARELKSQSIGQQLFFTQRNSQAKAATEALLQVSHSII